MSTSTENRPPVDPPCKEEKTVIESAEDFAEKVYRLSCEGVMSAKSTEAEILLIQADVSTLKQTTVDEVDALRKKTLEKAEEIEDKLTNLMRSKSRTISILGAIRQLTVDKFPAVTRLSCMIGIVVLALSSPRSTGRPEPVMPSQVELDKKEVSFRRACAALSEGNHAVAARELRTAEQAGCDPEFCLGYLAECQYRLKDDEASLATCDELAGRCPKSGWPQYVRGLVYKRQGRKEEAKESFRVAAIRGHPYAKLQLENMK